jgi:hypothetical protein
VNQGVGSEFKSSTKKKEIFLWKDCYVTSTYWLN